MDIGKRFDEVVAQHSNDTAIIWKDQTFTYKELKNKIDRYATFLSKNGIGGGDKVVMLSRTSFSAVCLAMAAIKIGAIVIPLNPSEGINTIANQIRHCDASVIFSTTEKLKLFQNLLSEDKINAPVIGMTPSEITEEDFTPAKSEPHKEDKDLAVIFYTSGSTGTPKAVALTHKNLLTDIDACIEHVKDIKPGYIMLNALPIFHSFGWTISFLFPLFNGLSEIIVEGFLPVENLIKNLLKANIFCGVPAMYSIIGAALAKLNMKLPNLKLAISGGDKLPIKVDKTFEQVAGIGILEGYGLTETSPVISVNPSYELKKQGSAGSILPGIKVRISSLTNDSVLPPGEIGEIQVKGDIVMKGYYKNAELTKQSFTEDGWFKTKDVGYLDKDGYLYIKERVSDLIIVGGFNVYPKEVEEVIASHPAVAEVAVIGITSKLRGQRVKAYIIKKPGAEVGAKEIINYCKQYLAHYKVPRSVVFVDELPKTPIGKVKKFILRKESEKENENN